MLVKTSESFFRPALKRRGYQTPELFRVFPLPHKVTFSFGGSDGDRLPEGPWFGWRSIYDGLPWVLLLYGQFILFCVKIIKIGKNSG